jgi:hypothetical protein
MNCEIELSHCRSVSYLLRRQFLHMRARHVWSVSSKRRCNALTPTLIRAAMSMCGEGAGMRKRVRRLSQTSPAERRTRSSQKPSQKPTSASDDTEAVRQKVTAVAGEGLNPVPLFRNSTQVCLKTHSVSTLFCTGFCSLRVH